MQTEVMNDSISASEAAPVQHSTVCLGWQMQCFTCHGKSTPSHVAVMPSVITLHADTSFCLFSNRVIVAVLLALPSTCCEYHHLVLNRSCALQKTAKPDAAEVDDDVPGDEL